MRDKNCLLGLLIFAVAGASVGCAPREEAGTEGTAMEESGASIVQAVAVLHPTEGSQARGTVTFRSVDAGIEITADLDGLAPGSHGFHIHQLGDCSAADATSAGGHFNPEGSAHGAPMDAERHVGDLGNVTADDAGSASYQRTDDVIAFAGAHSVIGRAVIVHAGEDDLVSQPTGDAGARVACGVIGIGQETSASGM